MTERPPPLTLPLDAAETKLQRAYWLLISTGYMKSALSLFAIVAVLAAVIITPFFFAMFIGGLGERPFQHLAEQLAQYFFIIAMFALLCTPAVGVYFLDVVTRAFSSTAGIVWCVLGGFSALVGILPNSPIWFLFVRSDLESVVNMRGLEGIVTVALILSVLLQIYFLWLVYRGIRVYFDAAPHEREILRESPQGHSRLGRLMIRYWGLPPTLDFVRRPRLRFVGLVVLAFVQSLALAVAAMAAIITPTAWLMHPIVCRSFRCRVDALDLFLPFMLMPIIFVLAALAGIAAQRVVQRLVRVSLSELQTRDLRAPILYLRSFQDDRIALPAPRLPLPPKILDYARRDLRLEHLLLEEGTPYGPVVALGDPNEKLPAYGAAKGYFDNASWRDAVAKIADESRAVVIALNVTDSIWWEVAHIVSSGHLDKTLFLMRPADAAPSANGPMLARLLAAIGAPGEAAGPADAKSPPVIALYRGGDGRLRFVKSRTFSRFAYLLALRHFLREKFGDPRPLPTPAPAPAVSARTA
jgi:hypothetical protein